MAPQRLSNDDQEQAGLLASERPSPPDESSLGSGNTYRRKPTHFARILDLAPLLLAFITGATFMFLSTTYWGMFRVPHDKFSAFPDTTYSPAQHVLEPQNVVFTSGFGNSKSIYQGPSNPEQLKAWEDLYSFGISRIPKSSAQKLVNKTIPIGDDPEYYPVELHVFHMLHCLKMIHTHMWSNLSLSLTEAWEVDHLSHCIDALRQSVMCASDISAIVWTWDPVEKRAKAVSEVQHTCRNFEKVRQWGRDNTIRGFNTSIHVVEVS